MHKSRSKSFSSRVRARRGCRVSALTCLSFLLGLVAGVAGLAGVGSAAPAGAAVRQSSVPVPTVQGPILPSSGISYLGSTTFNPSVVGYRLWA